MTKEATITGKIIRTGNSKGVMIPPHVLEYLGRDTGDVLEIRLRCMEKEE